MEENLVNIEADAPVTGTPSLGEEDSLQKTEPVIETEVNTDEEMTDEQLEEDIKRLSEEVEKEEDAKEKRHKQQDIGWKMKIKKEREKAKELTEKNRQLEQTLIEEAYNKAVDENYGLSYFEKLSTTNPEFADKVSQSKWGKPAKQLILESKRELAEKNNDEDLKKQITEEDIRQSEREKIYHEMSLKQVDDVFKDLSEEEHIEAKEYFDDIIAGKKLTPDKATKYADMAKLYATRNRKPKIDKEKIIASQASTGIGNNTPVKGGSTETGNIHAIRQQLLNSGVQRHLVDAMYPLN